MLVPVDKDVPWTQAEKVLSGDNFCGFQVSNIHILWVLDDEAKKVRATEVRSHFFRLKIPQSTQLTA